MANVHLLMRKEEIDDTNVSRNNIVVVFDILLATSTITTALYYGAKEVITVISKEEALKEAAKHSQENIIFIGEINGKAIDGFLVPHPIMIRAKVKNKIVILLSTNGTNAIRKAAIAKKVYVGSLLNGGAVAKTIQMQHSDEPILVICSGSSGTFSPEDFFGAGYFLDCLISHSVVHCELTDKARGALHFFRGTAALGDAVLKSSVVRRFLLNLGLDDVVECVMSRNTMPIAPYLVDGKRIIYDDDI